MRAAFAARPSGEQIVVRTTFRSPYDHYSTGRAIEQALGIAPLTANDKYATPLNDAFTGTSGSGGASTSSIAPSAGAVPAGPALTVAYQTTTNNVSSTDWIGLYPVGVTPGSQASTTWQYAAGSGGSVTFAAGSPPAAGTYALRYLSDNGYGVLAGPVDVVIQ